MIIKKTKTYTFDLRFFVEEPGTMWWHSHLRQ
jgi:hypothetical protein